MFNSNTVGGFPSGYEDRGRFLQSCGVRWERRGCQHLGAPGWRLDICGAHFLPFTIFFHISPHYVSLAFSYQPLILHLLFIESQKQYEGCLKNFIFHFIDRVWQASPAAEQTVWWVIHGWKLFFAEQPLWNVPMTYYFTTAVLILHEDNTAESHVNWLHHAVF